MGMTVGCIWLDHLGDDQAIVWDFYMVKWTAYAPAQVLVELCEGSWSHMMNVKHLGSRPESL